MILVPVSVSVKKHFEIILKEKEHNPVFYEKCGYLGILSHLIILSSGNKKKNAVCCSSLKLEKMYLKVFY